MSDLSSEETPQTPPYSVCVVFDSQLSSRKQLVKDINSSGMYKSVQEPDFLSPELFNNVKGQIDTCILGPNISIKNACSFLEQSLETEKGRNCSYVAVVEDSSSDEVAQLIERVDATLDDTYSIEKLMEILSESAETAKKRRPPEEFQLPRLKEIANGFYKGQYMLTRQGTPSQKTVDALEEMIQSLSAGNPKKYQLLRQLILPLLIDWFEDLAAKSEAVATRRLRTRLLQVLGGPPTDA